MGLFSRRKTIFVNADILVIGGGMAGCGATYEARYWGRDLKVVCVEKADIERSGAVAQGLYAINTYMGMQWDETSRRTTSATRETTSWVWCARTLATISPGTSIPRYTNLRSGAFR